jgi:hypothetical protein
MGKPVNSFAYLLLFVLGTVNASGKTLHEKKRGLICHRIPVNGRLRETEAVRVAPASSYSKTPHMSCFLNKALPEQRLMTLLSEPV